MHQRVEPGASISLSRKLRAHKAVGWVLIALGGLFFVSVLARDARLVVFGQKAEGVVLNAGAGSARNAKYAVSYRLPNGAEARFETSPTWGSRHRPGDTVPIIYLPSEPSRGEIKTMRQLVLPMAIGMLASSLCLASGICLLAWFRRVEEAWS